MVYTETLIETMDQRINGVYSVRNLLFMQTSEQRTYFLLNRVKRFVHCYENGIHRNLGEALAEIFAALCYCDDYFRGHLRFSDMISVMYPMTHCSYCFAKSCECSDETGASMSEKVVVEEQLHWSLSQWQAHLNYVYGDKNRARPDGGMEYAMNKLFEKLGAMKILHLPSQKMPSVFIQQYTHELSSVFAWTLGIANILVMNFEEEVKKIYPGYCIRCTRRPCNCPIPLVQMKAPIVHNRTTS